MWITHHKRIFLWHTARNILAIFYLLQIGIVASCVTEFDDVQSKALLSQIVIVGKISRLDSSPSLDYRVAKIQVLSILKQPLNGDIRLRRRQYLNISGFLPANSSPSITPVAQPSTLTYLAQTVTPHRLCLSYVNISENYILFINRTSDNRPQPAIRYHTAQLTSKYTRTDKKQIKDVICDKCATAPNAKAKRKLQVTEGTSNYKITCKVEGNPTPHVSWLKDNEALDTTQRGISIRYRRRRNVSVLTIKIKRVKLEHMGTYKCVAKNILGGDTAKSKITVNRQISAPRTMPPPPSGGDWESIDVDVEKESKEEELSVLSHYIPCTGRDKNYCLHGGECRVFPDGRYRHCRCLEKFAGLRCEEANIIPPPEAYSVQEDDGRSVWEELIPVVIALATALAILLLLMLIMAFYCAGWTYRSRKERKRKRVRYSVADHADSKFLEDSELKLNSRPTTLCISMATQTVSMETSFQQLRRSVNLENHFPHSSAGVVLRRTSFGTPQSRPSSQPLDRRPARSRLSGTSTLTESRQPNANEFQILTEQSPSSAPIENNITRPVSFCDNNPKPQTNCDHYSSSTTNSLYISESALDSISDDSVAAGKK